MEELEAVEYPLVPFVRNPRFGLVFPTHVVVCRERRKVVKLRSWIEDRIERCPVFTCAECGTPVYLRSSVRGRWYFRHQDGGAEDCPFRRGGTMNIEDIDAYRYNGQKEGRLHREMKRLVRESLGADTRFSDIKEEARWKGTYDPIAWRKPDLQALYNKLRIAFEMQPSATYINVIRARRDFYLREGGFLFWIFPRLDHPDFLRLYQEDVFFNNNSNLFVVDQETTNRASSLGKFMLRCHYCVPEAVGGEIRDIWKSKIVSIDELKIERAKQQVYYFDYMGERVRVQQAVTNAQADALRARLEDFWLRHGAECTHEAQAEYKPIRDALQTAGISVPEWYLERPFSSLMSLLFSAKHGRPVGFGHTKFIEVAHTAFQHHKQFLYPFGWVSQQHGTQGILTEQDHTGSWAKRREAFKQATRRRDSAFTPDIQCVPIVDFLFPGVGGRLQRMRQKWGSSETRDPASS